MLGRQIEQVALSADPAVEHDVEVRLAEGRGDLVLDHAGLHLAADDLLAFLDRGDAADVDPQGGIELERAAAGRRLRVAEHHADLLANLIDEDDDRAALGDRGGQFAHGLAHEPGLGAHGGLAHLALQLALGDEGGDGVDDDDIDGIGADQHVRDLQGLLAAVGLADQERLGVHAAALHPRGVEGVFGIDEGGHAIDPLRRGDDVQGERRLAAGLGAEDLDDPAAGHAEAAHGQVQGERPGADAVARGAGRAVQLHDGAFAVGLFDLLKGPIQGLLSLAVADGL